MSADEVAATIARELPGLPGWCTVEKGQRMAELARGAAFCVELGVFGGRGMIAMGLALREQGYGRVDGIDPYVKTAALEGTNDPANADWWAALDYEAIAHTAQATICKLGLFHCARIIRMRSQEVADCYADELIDVLHQDSNHSEEVSCEEVRLWSSKVKVGGYWIFDDTDWLTTKRAQCDLLQRGYAELEDNGNWKIYRRLQR